MAWISIPAVQTHDPDINRLYPRAVQIWPSKIPLGNREFQGGNFSLLSIRFTVAVVAEFVLTK